MAHRLIVQVVITGIRIFRVSFTEALKQANANSRHGKAAGGSASPFSSTGITLDEACKILNVSPPKAGKIDLEHVLERFKKQFDMNDPNKGGSFYLQSKILRARERLEMEAKGSADKAAAEKAAEEGWKPKLYKDR